MKSTVVIVGAAGSRGSHIAHRLAGKPYHLLLVDTDKEPVSKLVDTIRLLNEEADVELLECETDACWEGDIILLAMPYPIQVEIAAKIKQVCTGKIVISAGNPLNNIDELRKVLPYSKLVIAFDNIDVNDGGQTDSYIAGDDKMAVSVISQLVKDAGLRPVLVSLSETTAISE